MKIAFPNVKVGSVFELKYEKSSPYNISLNDFVFQSSVPVKYSRYQVTIPEYFKFRKRSGGYEAIEYSEKPVNVSFLLGEGNRLSCSAQEMTFVANNLPAMKNDSYIWNVNDFLTRVTFDLMSVNVPGVFYKSYSVNWTDIDKQLMENEKFGRQLSVSHLMKDELADVLKNNLSSNEKVVAILDLVKSKIQWNNENTLYIDNVRKAIKDGKGSSAEMNAALISLLRDAGFDAYPVVMSLRSRGRIFSPFPSLKSLNYFLTGVDIDGKSAYLDASYKYGAVNMVHTDCMVEEARCIFRNKPATWVDLHELGRNVSMVTIMAEFNEDGYLTGTVQRQMTGTPSIPYYSKVDKQKSVDDTRAEMETELNMRISNLEQCEPQNSSVMEKFSFENNEVIFDYEFYYVNPLIFPYLTENPFKAETRKLPVEFPFPYEHFMVVNVMVPDGYQLDEMPDSEIITLGDKQMSYTYQTQKNGNTVQVIQRITVRQTLYSEKEYQNLRDFWAHIADKNNAQLVLKRVTEQ